MLMFRNSCFSEEIQGNVFAEMVLLLLGSHVTKFITQKSHCLPLAIEKILCSFRRLQTAWKAVLLFLIKELQILGR